MTGNKRLWSIINSTNLNHWFLRWTVQIEPPGSWGENGRLHVFLDLLGSSPLHFKPLIIMCQYHYQSTHHAHRFFFLFGDCLSTCEQLKLISSPPRRSREFTINHFLMAKLQVSNLNLLCKEQIHRYNGLTFRAPTDRISAGHDSPIWTADRGGFMTGLRFRRKVGSWKLKNQNWQTDPFTSKILKKHTPT